MDTIQASFADRHEHRRGLLLGALVAFGALLATVKAGRTTALDLAVTLKVQGARSPLIRTAMAAVSWPGFPPQSRLIPPFVISAWWLSGGRREAVFQGGAWGANLLATVAKAYVRRERPLAPQVRVVVAPLGGTSFPSGHVLAYVAFYGFLAYLVATQMRPGILRRSLVALFSTLIVLVGPSRIEEGHHWATDVVASYLLGTVYLVGLVTLYERSSASCERTVATRLEPSP